MTLVAGAGKTRIPVRSLWFLLVYASDLLPRLRTAQQETITQGERDDDLADLIAEVLADEVEARLRRDLTLHYQPRRADLSRVRGRIDHLRTASQRLSERGRIACRFEELTIDSPRNRFIADSLLFAVPAVGTDIGQRCRAAAFRMHRLGVGQQPPSRAALAADRLSRNDIADQRMLDAARLLRQMTLPEHRAGLPRAPLLSDDPHLHRRLFEHAMRGFFAHTLHGHGWQVSRRQLHWTPDGRSEPRFVPRMQTDLTLDHEVLQRRIVIETKFTDALVEHHGSTTIKPAYLYQLYAYLASQSGRGDHRADTAEGVLLFVRTDGRDVFDGAVTVQGHRIRFLSIDLAEAPSSIRQRLLNCVDDRP
ncbi:hypothetical protein KIH27_00470 [Mycobacterium sp. M1]|uniref:5-methylcytosine-specific restriction endonuclease system specificity protein McrC n=1 Tax=Mycolicibacter acidiphilus TaxID=2835306 RepID=A0ABS5REE1_9MYCO|nr:hypothetical protein [Mycolicibacter acidiphilus]MBS9532059.1 hypothetical protein [Mycolicibacter acidiphilus]